MPPNGVSPPLCCANFAASIRPAGVNVAEAGDCGIRTLRDDDDAPLRPVAGVGVLEGVLRDPGVRDPGVRRTVPLSSVPTGPGLARLRRVSSASRRWASLSLAGKSLTSNCRPPMPPSGPRVASTLAMSTADIVPGSDPSGKGVMRGSRIMGVPSIEPHVICGESPSRPCRFVDTQVQTRNEGRIEKSYTVKGAPP